MRVRIKLMRNEGRWLTWNQKPREFEGTLLSKNAGKDEVGQMSCLYLSEGPSLFDPRVKSVFANEFRFVGMEKLEGGAWVLQEWNCEVVS